MTAEERFYRYWRDGGNTWDSCQEAFVKEIKAAEEKAREEGAKEAIVKFCEGDKSSAAQIESEGYRRSERLTKTFDEIYDATSKYHWAESAAIVRALQPGDD